MPTSVPARPKIVLLGMMTKMPVAGVVWQTLHYLLGFERLGYEAYYVEAHARTPSMLMARRGRRQLGPGGRRSSRRSCGASGSATVGPSTRCTTTAAATG